MRDGQEQYPGRMVRLPAPMFPVLNRGQAETEPVRELLLGAGSTGKRSTKPRANGRDVDPLRQPGRDRRFSRGSASTQRLRPPVHVSLVSRIIQGTGFPRPKTLAL